MKRIIREIHGRSLWQVLGIYVAGSWVALKVVETLAENENAAKYCAMFTELRADADEVLQPRVRAAQSRLEEILRARG